jgi:hypothetical protein
MWATNLPIGLALKTLNTRAIPFAKTLDFALIDWTHFLRSILASVDILPPNSANVRSY